MPFQKVYQHVQNSLQVVSPRLLNAQMRVQTGVANSADDGHVLLVRNEQTCFWVFVRTTETEVDQEQFAWFVLDSHHEVLRFDVTVYVAFCVQKLYFL